MEPDNRYSHAPASAAASGGPEGGAVIATSRARDVGNRRSLEDVHGTVAVAQAGFWRRLLAFAGPAYLVSVGYMDPGNWATDIAGGSQFHYELLWVLVM